MITDLILAIGWILVICAFTFFTIIIGILSLCCLMFIGMLLDEDSSPDII